MGRTEREKHNETYLRGANKDKLQEQHQKWPFNARGPGHDLPCAGKVKVIVLSLGFVGLKGPPCKTTRVTPASAVWTVRGPIAFGGSCIFINDPLQEVIGGFAGGHHREGLHCRRYQ